MGCFRIGQCGVECGCRLNGRPASARSPWWPWWARVLLPGSILGILVAMPLDMFRYPSRVGCNEHAFRALEPRWWFGTDRVVPLVGPDVLVKSQCSRHFVSAPRVGAVEHVVITWVQRCDGRRSNCGRTVAPIIAGMCGGSESHVHIAYRAPVYFVHYLYSVCPQHVACD